MKKSYVYKITCKITGEFYFGSSFRAKSDRYWGTGRKIKERISKYGKENFIKEILGEFDDRTIAHQVENRYIEKFRHDEKCLNIHLEHHFGLYGEESRTKIGAARLGKHRTDETRAKISDALRGEKNPMYGKTLSEETRAKMSAAKLGEKSPWYGKHLSDETRAKISAVHRGKHLSDETRAKISAVHRGKHLSEEHKARIGAAKRGKHLSEEHKARISVSKRGEKNPMYGKHWRKNPVTGKREYYD